MLKLEEIVAIQREQVLRWNRQFSLISRLHPEREVEALLTESVDCFRCLDAYLQQESARDEGLSHRPILYFDLGSGGGFPGLLWNHLFSASRVYGPGYLGGHLVEPRAKRTWFLEQCARAQKQTNLTVHEARWLEPGLTVAPSPEPATIIISLKALKLDAEVILAGLDAAIGPVDPQSRTLVLHFMKSGAPSEPDGPLVLEAPSTGSALEARWFPAP